MVVSCSANVKIWLASLDGLTGCLICQLFLATGVPWDSLQSGIKDGFGPHFSEDSSERWTRLGVILTRVRSSSDLDNGVPSETISSDTQ